MRSRAWWLSLLVASPFETRPFETRPFGPLLRMTSASELGCLGVDDAEAGLV